VCGGQRLVVTGCACRVALRPKAGEFGVPQREGVAASASTREAAVGSAQDPGAANAQAWKAWTLAAEPTPSPDKLVLPDGVVVPMTSPEALNAVTAAFAAMGQAAADLPPPVAEVDPASQPAVDRVIDVAHVDYALKNTARTATLDPDGLNAIMVRALGRAAREWLAARFSAFLNNPDAMPSRWRFSYIVPVPKPGKPVNDGAISLGHLRPVALTSILCRTFEKCVLRMMEPNIRALHPRQFGFRRGRTPLMAVIHAVEDAVDASRRVTPP
jgi:hypothetical protein